MGTILAGIRGAEVPDVFNLGPYGCSRRLYFQKIGEQPVDPCSVDDEQGRKAKLVIYYEFVIHVYQRQTKRVVRTPNQIFKNQRYPFILGDTDRIQTNLKNGRGQYVPLEIRILDRVSFYDIRKNGLPEEYNFMLHHYLIAKQATWGTIAFFSPDAMELKVFDVTYDENTAAEVINAERNFWNLVQNKKEDEIVPSGNPQNICLPCGYRFKCGSSEQYSPRERETLELTEITNKITNYLKEKS